LAVLACFLFCVEAQGRHFKIEQERLVKTKLGRYIDVRLSVEADMPGGKCYARAYFFDAKGNRMFRRSDSKPVPLALHHMKPLHVKFGVSETVYSRDKNWRCVIVFGDDKDATGIVVEPDGSSRSLHAKDFAVPEQALLKMESRPRRDNADHLTEIKCLTRLRDYPSFTLFARLPEGASTGKDTNGVLCLALLAGQVSEVRLALLNREARGDIADMLRYADNRNLMVLGWAVGQFWDPGKNWNELPPATAAAHDARMAIMANAWEAGVKKLIQKHDFAPRNFLLWGYSNSAQFAGRLALKKPDYFGAVHMHNPGSFDKPIAGAKEILWGLTMGEVDSGYGRALKFQRAAYDAGYRLIFKAVPGMGHDNDRASRQLATLLFDYALGLPKQANQRRQSIITDALQAPFVGDWLNQTVEKGDDRHIIPERLQVPLVTPVIAKSWAREQPLNNQEDPAGEQNKRRRE
jgi:pimeloyl-ACP methyl ester carboxylesterase